MRKTSRKLKTLIAAIGIAIAGGLAWKYTHPVPAEISELSRADFGRMEQTVRNAMWQKAFAGSTWKPLTSPRALWRLATARISQIELLPAGGAEVKLHTSLGDYYYCLVRNEPKEQSGWRVLSEGQGRQVSLHVDGIWATFSQVKVDGGVGLFGGRLSSGADGEELAELLRSFNNTLKKPPLAHITETNASFFQPIDLGYDRHRAGFDLSPNP